jgi:hypothetical protein
MAIINQGNKGKFELPEFGCTLNVLFENFKGVEAKAVSF